MLAKDRIIIKLATAKDLAPIADLEKQIWSSEGVDVFSIDHLASWLEVNAKGFFTAQINGKVIGYAFMQIMQLDPGLNTLPDTFIDMIDDGFCRTTHKPNGNFHFCVTVCSIFPGAGRLLVNAILKRATRLKKALIGVSRAVGLAQYIEKVHKKNALLSLSEQDELAIAWQYAVKSAKMVSGEVSSLAFPMNRAINLPELNKPDPVIAGYMKSSFTLVRPLQNFIHDPRSANYGMLCCQNSLK